MRISYRAKLAYVLTALAVTLFNSDSTKGVLMMYQKSCAVRYFPVSGAFPSTIIVVLGVTRVTKMENGSVKLSTENGVAFYLPKTKVIEMTGGDARLVPPVFECDKWDEDQSYYLSEDFKNLCHETDRVFIVEDHRFSADGYPVFF